MNVTAATFATHEPVRALNDLAANWAQLAVDCHGRNGRGGNIDINASPHGCSLRVLMMSLNPVAANNVASCTHQTVLIEQAFRRCGTSAASRTQLPMRLQFASARIARLSLKHRGAALRTRLPFRQDLRMACRIHALHWAVRSIVSFTSPSFVIDLDSAGLIQNGEQLVFLDCATRLEVLPRQGLHLGALSRALPQKGQAFQVFWTPFPQPGHTASHSAAGPEAGGTLTMWTLG